MASFVNRSHLTGLKDEQSVQYESSPLIMFGSLPAFRPLLCMLQGHKAFPAVPDHKTTRFLIQLSLTAKIKHSPLPSDRLNPLFLFPRATCSQYCKSRQVIPSLEESNLAGSSFILNTDGASLSSTSNEK